MLDYENVAGILLPEEVKERFDRSTAGFSLAVFLVGVTNDYDVAVRCDHVLLVHKCLFSIAFQLKDAVT